MEINKQKRSRGESWEIKWHDWTEASRFYSMYSFGHNKNVERWYCSGGKILWISFLILKIVLGLLCWDDPEEVVISADPPRSFTKMMVKVQKALNIMET